MDIIILWAQTYMVCRFGQRGGRESNNLVFDILLSGNPWRFLALNNPLPYLPPMHKCLCFFYAFLCFLCLAIPHLWVTCSLAYPLPFVFLIILNVEDKLFLEFFIFAFWNLKSMYRHVGGLSSHDLSSSEKSPEGEINTTFIVSA